MHFADLAGRETKQSIIAFFSHQLSRSTSTAGNLTAFANFKLNIVNHSTKRHIFQRQTVADFDISIRSAFDNIAYFKV